MNTANKSYRAASWWLTWDDISWPDKGVSDKIMRRADKAAENGVNCAFIFGAHFRWDFMPLWDRLHNLLAFIAAELHQREIKLFDHHSSVLTHRPRTPADAWDIRRRNCHHVPFYPYPDAAMSWTFEKHFLNEWRMLDVETGAPVFLPAYAAEQFCMNNPYFQKAYRSYIKRLVTETGIDGLMSDDGIFYAGWRACACQWCRKRFREEYGHTLPTISTRSFWGNRESAAFKDWITMRYQTSSDFLAGIRSVLPVDFPLLTCCSSSISYEAPADGMTYQEFIKSCNIVFLEMCGSMPTLGGTWDNRVASQLMHLGIARDHQRPTIGLGYAFSPLQLFLYGRLINFWARIAGSAR